MRDLEFRAWWKDTKRFLDCDEWYMTCSGAKYLHYAVMPYKDDNFIIEQFTGLKDKNGQKIFEGDIVKYDDGDAYGVCSFNGCFGIKNRNLSVLYSSYTFNDNDLYSSTGKLRLEVIGNIHENPELLEVKNVD